MTFIKKTQTQWYYTKLFNNTKINISQLLKQQYATVFGAGGGVSGT